MTRLGPSRRMRGRFDFDAWLKALSRAALARGVTWKELSAATGVSEATLSRMRLHARHPDAASLAALSAWAGLNPANYMLVGEYRTAAGHAFIFDGWPAGESPLELFDASKWLECLHACMFAASRRVLLEDDQVLHELVHLALGIDICTHNTMAGLREAVKELT